MDNRPGSDYRPFRYIHARMNEGFSTHPGIFANVDGFSEYWEIRVIIIV
jgi:hypothetical protein